MSEIESFRDLIVWQKSMTLAEEIHKATEGFAGGDLFTLGTQMRKSSQSVPSNLAEGFNRHAKRAYRNHVSIACGSASELETQLELSKRLRLISGELVTRLQTLVVEISRMLFGLWRSLAPAAVCYSWLLFAFAYGLRPMAYGLFHGFTRQS
jgi:four helix bundle protein